MEHQPRLLFLVTSSVSLLFVRGQVGALRDHGFHVDVATNLAGTGPLTVDGVAVHHIPFEREPSPLHDLHALWKTVALLRRLRPDVVHAGTPKAGLLGTLAGFIACVPVRVYAVHGLRYETTTGRQRTLLRSLERLACRAATQVVPDSDSLAAVVERDGLAPRSKVTVIGPGSSNGLDIERFAPQQPQSQARESLGLPDSGVVVGFVGRLTKDKGIDDLVEWFVRRDGALPLVHLLLVGPEEEGDAISARTLETVTCHPQVVHIPWLDDPRAAYDAMDVLAFPSYREGLPNVPLEAQSMGVPVVGYRATGTVDAVADPSLLAGVGEVKALGETLDRLVGDPTERDRRGREAAAWVRARFDRRAIWELKAETFSTWLGRR